MATPKRKTTPQNIGVQYSKMFGRIKGETIGALEQAELAVGQALQALREEGQSAALPGAALIPLRNAHSALSKVLAKQQFAKGVESVLSGQHEI